MLLAVGLAPIAAARCRTIPEVINLGALGPTSHVFFDVPPAQFVSEAVVVRGPVPIYPVGSGGEPLPSLSRRWVDNNGRQYIEVWATETHDDDTLRLSVPGANSPLAFPRGPGPSEVKPPRLQGATLKSHETAMSECGSPEQVPMARIEVELSGESDGTVLLLMGQGGKAMVVSAHHRNANGAVEISAPLNDIFAPDQPRARSRFIRICAIDKFGRRSNIVSVPVEMRPVKDSPPQ